MLRTLMSAVGLLLLSGCAGFLHGSGQSLQVSTWCKDRQIPAACTAHNGKGSWAFVTPSQIQIQKDFSHLQLSCKSPFFNEVTVTVPSMLNLTTAGNVVLGGVVGTGLDVYTGAAFAYQRDVRISYPICE